MHHYHVDSEGLLILNLAYVLCSNTHSFFDIVVSLIKLLTKCEISLKPVKVQVFR